MVPVGIERSASGTHHQGFDQKPSIDRERCVIALTGRRVSNVGRVWLKFGVMLMSLHAESEGMVLAPVHGPGQLLDSGSGDDTQSPIKAPDFMNKKGRP